MIRWVLVAILFDVVVDLTFSWVSSVYDQALTTSELIAVNLLIVACVLIATRARSPHIRDGRRRRDYLKDWWRYL